MQNENFRENVAWHLLNQNPLVQSLAWLGSRLLSLPTTMSSLVSYKHTRISELASYSQGIGLYTHSLIPGQPGTRCHSPHYNENFKSEKRHSVDAANLVLRIIVLSQVKVSIFQDCEELWSTEVTGWNNSIPTQISVAMLEMSFVTQLQRSLNDPAWQPFFLFISLILQPRSVLISAAAREGASFQLPVMSLQSAIR